MDDARLPKMVFFDILLSPETWHNQGLQRHFDDIAYGYGASFSFSLVINYIHLRESPAGLADYIINVVKSS